MAHLLTSLASGQWWEEMPYASVLKIELRVNNDCMNSSTDFTDDTYCFKVRMKYNGDYINFRLGTFFNAHEKNTPSGNKALIDTHEEEAEVVYDLLWAEYIDIYGSWINYNGSLKNKCAEDYNPNKNLTVEPMYQLEFNEL